MRRAVVLSVHSFDLLAPAVKTVEQLGLDRVWVTEIPGRDAIVRAMHVANSSQSIEVGTGIAYAFSRHPLAMASAAIEANAATGGRITVGIGAGPGDIRQALDVDFSKPAARLGEYVSFVRAAIAATDGLQFDGRFYRADLPAFRGAANIEARQQIEIFGSGINPLALRTMARHANGVALHPLGVFLPYLDQVVLPAIKAGADGRSVKIAAWCVTSIDHDRAAAIDRARTRLALYLANPAFNGVLTGTPWEHCTTELQEAVGSGHGRTDWQAIGKVLPEDLIDNLAVVGSPDEVRDKLTTLQAGLADRGVTELALQIPAMGGTDEQLLSEIQSLAEAVATKDADDD